MIGLVIGLIVGRTCDGSATLLLSWPALGQQHSDVGEVLSGGEALFRLARDFPVVMSRIIQRARRLHKHALERIQIAPLHSQYRQLHTLQLVEQFF